MWRVPVSMTPHPYRHRFQITTTQLTLLKHVFGNFPKFSLVRDLCYTILCVVENSQKSFLKNLVRDPTSGSQSTSTLTTNDKSTSLCVNLNLDGEPITSRTDWSVCSTINFKSISRVVRSRRTRRYKGDRVRGTIKMVSVVFPYFVLEWLISWTI
jgi:hypothetical protein